MKKILLVALATATMSVQAADFMPASHNWNNGSVDMVKKTIGEAYEWNAKAKVVDSEWRDTEMFIKEAEALRAEGKQEAALKAAKFAKHQAWLSVQQGIEQNANAGPHNHF